MKKRTKWLAAAIVTAFALPAVAGGPPAGAGEGRGKPDGIACQQAGISTLQALGLLPAVARDGIEVESMGESLGVFDFATVLELHRAAPELFQTGGVSVIVGGQPVAATWCDPAE